MLSFIKKTTLKNHQRKIDRLKPSVNIKLGLELPTSAIAEISSLAKYVSQINSLEEKVKALSDQGLRDKTEEFKEHVFKKEKELESQIIELKERFNTAVIPEEKDKLHLSLKNLHNKVFDNILCEAFSVVREAARRVCNMRHFDSQLLGGIILHQGKIAEMATGEGKTLVATLPAYLNALLGRGVHIVTVNDYLARRDREWMGPIYEFLGLSVGVIQHDLDPDARRYEYSKDVTYGTNNEFGFDYLRDNMVIDKSEMVQRPFHYAIVDEVDSILVDEARTPLIISGPAEESTEKYYIADKVISKLKGKVVSEKEQIDAKYKGIDISQGYDYLIDEKAHAVHLTEEGEVKVSKSLGIPSLHEIETIEWRHHIIQALMAHSPMYRKDVQYIIKDGKVVIVDEFTGRIMPGRRWSDGLHQAIEAKENLKIERENQTLATITFQNYFRMYEKLAGMTGTAFTEAQEFKQIYKLDVIPIPTNRVLIRKNYPDIIYKTEKEKFDAIILEIVECYKNGQPVLVGTISIENSEIISNLLQERGIPHNVLNAKYHEMEAQIIAQAGRFKAITIATNMAGRGTDILLGGNPDFLTKTLLREEKIAQENKDYNDKFKLYIEKFRKQASDEHNKVIETGGLHVIGTERHEARRIDNQLRGRSGRQGDPGSSRFYVSLEDDLMRIFGSDRLIGLLDKFSWQAGQAIEHPWVSKSIETAQRRVEQHNFEIRKQLLEYDNVMNKQREVIYGRRKQVLEGQDIKEDIFIIADEILDIYIQQFLSGEERDYDGLDRSLKDTFGIVVENFPPEADPPLAEEELKDYIFEKIKEVYHQKEITNAEQLKFLERFICLQVIDTKWKEHLYAMDTLREGISLRAYGQRDPLIEYQREAFNMFSGMIESIKLESVQALFKVKLSMPRQVKGVFDSVPQSYIHPEKETFKEPHVEPGMPQETPSKPVVKTKEVGRNEPCPCKSGRKYKKCCGR
ncbi:MAG: preprotein translocase subunit SecA [Candidatus Omnitrophota bacterium]